MNSKKILKTIVSICFFLIIFLISKSDIYAVYVCCEYCKEKVSECGTVSGCSTYQSSSCSCPPNKYPVICNCGWYEYSCNYAYRDASCPDGDMCSRTLIQYHPGPYTVYYTGSCSCCNPGPCVGCTPVCPTGYSPTPNNCGTTTATCSGNNGCSSCTISLTCYLNETNIAPPMPTSISIIVDGTTYQLSTNPDSPTKIKLPSTSPTVQVSVPTISIPSTSGGVGYKFMADNYGNNDEWKGWKDCSGDVGEDFCSEDSSNTQNFNPTSLTILQVLKENSEGKISGLNYTLNKCDSDKKYSLPIEGYYIVDQIPDDGGNKGDVLPEFFTDSTSKGCTSSTYTGKEINNPLHVRITANDPDSNDEINGGILWLSKDTTVPETTTISSAIYDDNNCNTGYYIAAPGVCCPIHTTYSNGSCTASRESMCPTGYYYNPSTGYCERGPLRRTPCPSGYRSVGSGLCCPTEAGFKNGMCVVYPHCPSGYEMMPPSNPSYCCPKYTTLSGGVCTASPKILSGIGSTNDIALLIKKETSWASPQLYYIDTGNNWRPLIDGSDGNKYIRVGTDESIAVRDVSVTQSASVVFDFKLEFKDTATKPSGLYNLYTGAVDTYMINSNKVDQSRLSDITDWGIDLTDPSVGNITQSVNDIQNVLLSWNSTDLESNITDIVINGYRNGGSATTFIELFIPPSPYLVSKGAFLPQPIPEDDQIGILSDLSSAWHFTNSAMSRVETDKINIGDNEGGNINIYITTYDEGCNTNGTYENIDLNPWVTSYGGTVYSNGGIINAAKDVSEVDALDGVFENITKENLDTGTETISSRASNITNLVKNLGVTAPNIYDTNDRKTYWYDHFTEKLNNEKIEGAQNFTEKWSNNDLNVSSNCTADVCYYKGLGNISIRSGFICDKKTLFMTEGDITINPDVTTSDTSTGCIFFAKGDIHIAAGGYKSAAFSTTQYDYLDAYLIAEGQIIFDLVDAAASVRDGIEIKGGLVAFGEGTTGASAIYILRNLKLFSQTSPTVVLVYDPRYPIISSQFFGTEAPIYKQEVGFKNF